MTKSYCVKEKRVTDCVPGSEKYVTARNGRVMMKCVCASCGITKSRFVKGTESQNGGIGLSDALIRASYGIGKRMVKQGSKQALQSDYLRNFVKNKSKDFVGNLINREVDDITSRLARKL